MTIYTVNGRDTIRELGNGQYRAHRVGVYWIGDYPTYRDAIRALQIANSAGARKSQRGIYDGGVYASEENHVQACGDLFGVENCVTMDDVRRTILPGETMQLAAGVFPVRQ